MSWLFILCLELGEPSSILLHVVPVYYCCSPDEPVWSVKLNVVHMCSSLESILQRDSSMRVGLKGNGVFPGDLVSVVLGSQLP